MPAPLRVCARTVDPTASGFSQCNGRSPTGLNSSPVLLLPDFASHAPGVSIGWPLNVQIFPFMHQGLILGRHFMSRFCHSCTRGQYWVATECPRFYHSCARGQYWVATQCPDFAIHAPGVNIGSPLSVQQSCDVVCKTRNLQTGWILVLVHLRPCSRPS